LIVRLIIPVKILYQLARKIGAFKTPNKTFGGGAVLYFAFATMLRPVAASKTAGARFLRCQMLIADGAIYSARG
jgi:hypothetical protein